MRVQRRLKLAVAAYVIADITKMGVYTRNAMSLERGEKPPVFDTLSLTALEIAGLLAFYRTELDILQKSLRVWVANMPPEPFLMIVIAVLRGVMTVGYMMMLKEPSRAALCAKAVVVLSAAALALYAARYSEMVHGFKTQVYQESIHGINEAFDVAAVTRAIDDFADRYKDTRSAVRKYIESYVRL